MAYLGRKGASAALTTADIPDNSITSAKIVDGAVAVADLGPDSVDSSELVDGSIDTAHIGDDQVTADKLHTNAVFASGTKMIFNQTAAPTGWTKVTGSGNDTALRVTTGTVGTGGSVAFETAFASQTIPTHSLSEAEMPAHTHAVRGNGNDPPGGTGADANILIHVNGSCLNNLNSNTSSKGSGTAHGHGSVNLDVSYVDVIIATKD